MTKKLFYEDAYATKFQATVLEVTPANEAFLIVLDQTMFYPEGGGQPADRGYFLIDGEVISVSHVSEKNHVIYHKCNTSISVGTKVTGNVDFKRRFDHMQQHTGEHILTGIIHGKYGYDNVGFHMGEIDVTIDFDGVLNQEDIAFVQTAANEEAVKQKPVRCCFPDNLEELEYRSKKALEGDVRICFAGDVDVCACCGTHTATTSEVLPIAIIDYAPYKNGTRLRIRCGNRALEYYQTCNEQLHQISRLLSAKLEVVPDYVENLYQQYTNVKQQLQQEKRKNFQLLAQQLEPIDGMICIEKEQLASDELAAFGKMLSEKADLVCIISPQEDAPAKLCIVSETLDTNAIGRGLCSEFGGKGGGKKGAFQGFIKQIPEDMYQTILKFLD